MLISMINEFQCQMNSIFEDKNKIKWVIDIVFY